MKTTKSIMQKIPKARKIIFHFNCLLRNILGKIEPKIAPIPKLACSKFVKKPLFFG